MADPRYGPSCHADVPHLHWSTRTFAGRKKQTIIGRKPYWLPNQIPASGAKLCLRALCWAHDNNGVVMPAFIVSPSGAGNCLSIKRPSGCVPLQLKEIRLMPCCHDALVRSISIGHDDGALRTPHPYKSDLSAIGRETDWVDIVR